jgi:hypothetical protein
MANKRNTREVGTGQQPATSKGNEVRFWLKACTHCQVPTIVLFTDHSLGPKKAFEFLKLPPEIRNKIYWNVLVKKRYRCFFFQPPLTFVNKQIRSESLPVLYGNSSFIVCFDDNSFSGDPQKLSRLRKRWEILSPVSEVSPIPSFAFVTKLDIRYSFSDAATPENCVVFHIYMRNNDSDCTSSSNSRLVCRPGSGWKSCANIWTVCYELVNSASIWPSRTIRTDLEDVDLVIKTLFFFAEKCPAAAEWVWVEVERQRWGQSTLI